MKIDLIISFVLVALTALLYSFSSTPVILPGFDAEVLATWLGLNDGSYELYPLSKMIAGTFSYSPFASVLAGLLSVFLFYHIALNIHRHCFGDSFAADDTKVGSRVFAVLSTVIFALTPCVFDSSIHLGPSIFDAYWAMLALAVLLPYANAKAFIAWLFPILSGICIALGTAESVMFLFMLPLAFLFASINAAKRGTHWYIASGLILLGFLAAIGFAVSMIGDIDGYVKFQYSIMKQEMSHPYWYCPLLLSVMPFIASFFISFKPSGGEKGIIPLVYHSIMSVVAVLVTASVLSPSSALGVSGYSPVIVAAFAAFVPGYVIAYWWSLTRTSSLNEDSDVKDDTRVNRASRIGKAGMYTVVALLLLTVPISFFAGFNSNRGAYAEEVSKNVLADLGERTWLVSNGLLDNSFLIQAYRQGRELNLISLNRENDSVYMKRLAKKVSEKNLAGNVNNQKLLDILTADEGLDKLRLLPFIEQWFKLDSEISSKVAVWGAPHLWMSVGIEPITEQYFFGADVSRSGDWSKSWKDFSILLDTPKNWSSYAYGASRGYRKLKKEVRIACELRRHIGLVATNQGAYHHFKGLKLWNEDKKAQSIEHFEKAFALYELVLREIDSDNLSALINEELLASNVNFKRAKDKHKEIMAKLMEIKADKYRRYDPRQLYLLYGYICDPKFMLNFGQALMSRGSQYDLGAFQIRRAMDLVPSDHRKLVELNVLASLYAETTEKEKARDIYNKALKEDPTNRVVLSRLSQLEMLEGRIDKAIEYLQKALNGVETNPEYQVPMAQLHLLKEQYAEAEEILKKVLDNNPADVNALSLLSVTLMRIADSLADSTNPEMIKRREACFNEIDKKIIPAMEKHATGARVHMLQSTRAFALMRKGGVENMKLARDSFVEISKRRPSAGAANDMVMSLDIQIDDKVHAEQQANETLRSDPENCLANYIIGSISLGGSEYAKAEKHLRLAVKGPKPVPLAFNDLAEVLRRQKKFGEAENVARHAVKVMPKLYVVWETLGSILMDAGKSLDEAESSIQKACELSKDESGKQADVRMLISLARVQIKRGEMLRAKGTMRTVLGRISELSEFEKKEFEELRKSVK